MDEFDVILELNLAVVIVLVTLTPFSVAEVLACCGNCGAGTPVHTLDASGVPREIAKDRPIKIDFLVRLPESPYRTVVKSHLIYTT